MQFEHLVAVNDPFNPLSDLLTRAQLWQGLVIRAERPTLFSPDIDRIEITARGDGWIQRELWMGPVCVRDRVSFEVENRVVYQVEASDRHGGGTLSMQIEEPSPTALFVRFRYDSPQALESAPTDGVDYIGYLKEAYRQSDLDTVRRIRAMAEAGEL